MAIAPPADRRRVVTPSVPTVASIVPASSWVTPVVYVISKTGQFACVASSTVKTWSSDHFSAPHVPVNEPSTSHPIRKAKDVYPDLLIAARPAAFKVNVCWAKYAQSENASLLANSVLPTFG